MEFSFSTVQQYKLLLEQSGWKLREKDGLLILYKGGETVSYTHLAPCAKVLVTTIVLMAKANAL